MTNNTKIELTNYTTNHIQYHPYHLVSPSPWPLHTSIPIGCVAFCGALSMHNFEFGYIWWFSSLILVIASMSLWFKDVIAEGTYLGDHTSAVQTGLYVGVILFIVSEALFFMAIFWAYFHSALTPTIELGSQWPPLGIEPVNPFELPLLNTVILLSSGATITYAHHGLINQNRSGGLNGTLFTIILAIIFTLFQAIEYKVSSFTISDGAFGTCFFFGTGLILAPIRKYIDNKLSIHRHSYSTIKYIDSKNKLDPYWVTGFCDAESSFSIRVGKDEKRFKSLRISPIFTIELHEKDSKLLEQIREFFTVGTIIKRIKNGNPSVIYSIQSIKILKQVIIPHFNKYSLLTQKKEDFRLFSLVVDMLYNHQHKTEKGLNEILSHKASINKGLSKLLLNMFPDIKPIERNQVLPPKDFNPLWVAGFVCGEGCFYVKTSKINSGYKVNAYFSLSQHIRDIALLENLINYLNCGLVETVKTRPTQSTYVVYKFKDILNNIIPFFDTYCLRGNKLLDFYDFKKVVNILGNINKYEDSNTTLKQIIKIKKNMNRNR